MVVVPVLTIVAMVLMLMVEGGGTDSGNDHGHCGVGHIRIQVCTYCGHHNDDHLPFEFSKRWCW